MKNLFLFFLVIALSTLSNVHASVIRSAVSVSSNVSSVVDENGVPYPDYVLNNIINQSGLSSTYTSGATDFDSYLYGSDPILHGVYAASVLGGLEWFAEANTTSAQIDFSLGGLFSLDRIALWNEDLWGIKDITITLATNSSFTGNLNVFVFTDLFDNPVNVEYSATVLDLSDFYDASYVRFDVVGPRSLPPGFNNDTASVSLGEVAFSTNIPEPSILVLFATGFIGFGFVRRKKYS